MEENPDIESLSDVFQALSDPTRLRILNLLKGNPHPICVNGIAQHVGISQSAVSQHLKILRHAGFVKSERRGYWVPHSIDVVSLEHCCDALNEVCRCGCTGPGHSQAGHPKAAQSLRSLKQYRKNLEKELRKVEKKIEQIEKQDR